MEDPDFQASAPMFDNDLHANCLFLLLNNHLLGNSGNFTISMQEYLSFLPGSEQILEKQTG